MEIIIVDDEPVSLTVLKQLVEKLPHCHARGFTQATAALAWCEPNDPDVVIVDYMMPEVNGIEFTRRLCALEGRVDTPLLMVSASTDRQVRTLALQSGINDFMNKPFDFIELQTRVSDMLSLRSSQIKMANRALRAGGDKASAMPSREETGRLFDMRMTLARLAGDEILLAEIARIFLRTVPQLLASIDVALSVNCLERAYAEAHSLKGAVAALEAPEVLNAVVALEQHAKNYNSAATGASFDKAQLLIERLLGELQAMVAGSAAAS